MAAMKKSRKYHHKSRNGCAECKRRKIKCDEAKPSCKRCTLLLFPCIYASESHSTSTHLTIKPTSEQHLSTVTLPPSPLPSPLPTLSFTNSPPFEFTISPSPPLSPIYNFLDTEHNYLDTSTFPIEFISESILFDHFTQHTYHTLGIARRRLNMPSLDFTTLPSESNMVYYSMLAVSAACICIDMIKSTAPASDSCSDSETSSTNAVNMVLITAYHYYNLASAQMRECLSAPEQDSQSTYRLLATAMLLIPCATGTQQVTHWLSTHRSQSTTKTRTVKELTATPRDVMVLMRGIRTTLHTLVSRSEFEQELETHAHSPLSVSDTPTSRRHPMFTIITSTSSGAFSKLRSRIDALSLSSPSSHQLEACKAAFEYLNGLRNTVFSPSDMLVDENAKLSRLPGWLRDMNNVSTPPEPHESLTGYLLPFLVHVPQGYLDIVLPLLDRRLEPTTITPDNVRTGRTGVEALALDIYAHWSVLMFLVEEESWWIGALPEVTLRSMVATYGDDFVAKTFGGVEIEGERAEKWWPASMLGILGEIKRFR